MLGPDARARFAPGQFEALRNPIAQAELLASHGCEFNIVMGRCIGPESLVFRYAKGLTTVLVAKDRVLGPQFGGGPAARRDLTTS